VTLLGASGEFAEGVPEISFVDKAPSPLPLTAATL
jgi:hypothetical protein